MSERQLNWKEILGFEPSVEQLQAITAPMEPARIIAGAGTGKTAVMACRIIWLIHQGLVQPDKVLGLTFTTKAANELAVRVRKLMPSLHRQLADPTVLQNFGEPIIMTYNAFGAKLLKEHALRIGLEPDARVVVDALKYQLAFRVIANTQADFAAVGYSPTGAVSDMMALDQALANYMVDPDELAKFSRTMADKYVSDSYSDANHEKFVETLLKREQLCVAISEYRKAKIEHAIIDYSDQIRLAAQASQESVTMRNQLREEFQVVLLDEYQDTSISQRDLLCNLFGDGFPVMAVGDPCQAIYRWRGAEISNMDNFATDFPRVTGQQVEPCQSFSLTENRRSAPEILRAANAISAPIRAVHENVKELVPGRTDIAPATIETHVAHSYSDEIDWISQRIASLGSAGNWKDCAVLVREKKNVDVIVAKLEALGVPVQVADTASLFALPEVREVLCYLQVIADPCANPSLVRILQGPRWAIGARDLAILGQHAAHLANERPDLDGLSIERQLETIVAGVDRAERVSLLDALELADDPTFAYSIQARERLAMLAQELRELRRHLGESTVDLINRIIRVTGIGVEAMMRAHGGAGTRFDRLATLIDVAGNFSDIDGYVSVQAFLSYVADSDRFATSVEAELPMISDAVSVMSIHKAKGLEFPIVALPGVTAKVFPSTVAEDYWVTKPFVVPPQMLTTPTDQELLVFPALVENFKSDYEDFKAHVRMLNDLDETRLAYVAVTRAQHTLLTSSSIWGPTQANPRGPSKFLEQLRDFETQEGLWSPMPAKGAKNPTLTDAPAPVWPIRLDESIASEIHEAANLVTSQLPTNDELLTDFERHEVELWDRDLEVIVDRVMTAPETVRSVRLPSSLTASQIMALAQDPDGFTRNLIRPMPRQPSAVADRGTRFHAWVETFYGNPGLYNPDELPGSVDSEIYTDQDLIQLRQQFERGKFSARTPVGMEVPFGLVLAGRTVRGRIDAVFSGTIDDEKSRDYWLVVDWKTGKVGSGNPLQLEIYRHAWAKIAGVSPEKVSAAFYYVGQDEVVEAVLRMSLVELEELIQEPSSVNNS